MVFGEKKRILELEKRIKELEAENAALKKENESLNQRIQEVIQRAREFEKNMRMVYAQYKELEAKLLEKEGIIAKLKSSAEPAVADELSTLIAKFRKALENLGQL
ncbi:MAG: hypothetical protein QXL15_01470 [Candidatus Korarchaeota archaeon]